MRLFVALDLPGGVGDALGAWAREAFADDDRLRLLGRDALHATLCFIGWREAGEAEAIAAAIGGCAAPVGDLGLEEAVWLPRRRPRLAAVGLADPRGALGELQARVSQALVDAAGYEPERRDFWPHVTVARVRGRERVRARELPQLPALAPFPGAALTLYRSHLARGGARYEALASQPLR